MTGRFLPMNVDVIILTAFAHQAKNREGYFAFHLYSLVWNFAL